MVLVFYGDNRMPVASATAKIHSSATGVLSNKKPALFSPETCAGFLKVPDRNAGELGRVVSWPGVTGTLNLKPGFVAVSNMRPSRMGGQPESHAACWQLR